MMALALNVLLALIALPIGLITAYVVFLTAAAYVARKKTNPDAPPLSVAVAIPAHNESGQIEGVIRTLFAADYSQDKYEVFVIADNCSDDTAERARQAGANVAERNDPENPGKGQALEWFLKTYRERLEKHDAIAIIDADSNVHPRFLPEISASLSHPAVKVVQAYDGVGNAEANWRTALTYAGFVGVNHVRTAGRSIYGGTATLKGNGMAFDSRLLLDYGWPAHSVVEDMELSVQFLLDGIRVAYNPDASVISEMPTSGKQAESQRRRWEGGRFQLVQMYGCRLLRAFLKKPRLVYLDTLLELLVPPLSLLVLMQLGYLVLAAALLQFHWALLGGAYLAGTGFYVFSCLWLRRAPWRVWLALMAAPFFVLWKIPIYLGLLLKGGQKGWVRTTRNAEAQEAEDGSDSGD